MRSQRAMVMKAGVFQVNLMEFKDVSRISLNLRSFASIQIFYAPKIISKAVSYFALLNSLYNDEAD